MLSCHWLGIQQFCKRPIGIAGFLESSDPTSVEQNFTLDLLITTSCIFKVEYQFTSSTGNSILCGHIAVCADELQLLHHRNKTCLITVSCWLCLTILNIT